MLNDSMLLLIQDRIASGWGNLLLKLRQGRVSESRRGTSIQLFINDLILKKNFPRRQAIIWINDALVYWRIHASHDLDELNRRQFEIHVQLTVDSIADDDVLLKHQTLSIQHFGGNRLKLSIQNNLTQTF